MINKCGSFFLIRIFVVLIVSNLSVMNYAYAKKDKKNTVINFDDQLIKGEGQNPDLFYIMQKKQFNHGRLLKLRENFLPELRETKENINRTGR